MVAFSSEPATTILDQDPEDCNNQSLNLKTLNDPLENSDPKFSDLSFADSLLDFDFISDFLNDNPEPDRFGFQRSMDSNNNGTSAHSHVEEDSIVDGFDPIMKKKETLELHIGGNLSSCIEKDMKRVSLVDDLSSVSGVNGAIGEGEKVDVSHGSSSVDAAESFVKSEVEGGEAARVSLAGDLSSVNGDNGGIGEAEKVDISHGSSSVDANERVVKSEVEGGEAGEATIGSVNGSNLVSTNEIIVDGVAMKDKDDSGSESDSESDDTSSSSSDSSEDNDDNDGSSDEETEEEEEGKVKAKTNLEKNRKVNVGEIEEGEIAESKDDDEDEEEEVDKMVGWDDIELEDDQDTGAMGGPIRSKNELQDLPPVPPVDVRLEPHHQMRPVGGVLSILGAQVIVEGAQKHNPLSEGSLLWITESRSPLGWVDEIFGPVKNPYYVVRYNSESEVPTGIHVGSSISFVAEFANHVLNDQNLYKKGYDASGENDEEVSDELEFSDDEKEAEYKRKLKMSKRGNDDQIVGNKRNNRKKGKNRDRNWNNNKSPSDQTPRSMASLPMNQNQNIVSPVGAPTSGAGFVQQLSTMTQSTAGYQPRNGLWGEGVKSQQPMNTVLLPLGFPSNNIHWPPQNQFQIPFQMPVPNSMPFLQFNQAPAPLPNAALLGGQPLFSGGSAFPPWPDAPDQNPFNQTAFGMGLGSQPPQQFMNVMNMGDEGVTSNVNFAEGNLGELSGDAQPRQHFNMGSRGRKPHHRGGRRFAGNRGRGR